jgi:hypothetical protein
VEIKDQIQHLRHRDDYRISPDRCALFVASARKVVLGVKSYPGSNQSFFEQATNYERELT